MLYVLTFILGVAGGALGYRWLVRRAPDVLDDAKRKVEDLGK